MEFSYYFYILRCNDGTKYYGHTDDLKRRIKDHSKREVKYTRDKLPIELIYYEEFDSRSEAFRREMQFKNGKTRKEMIEKLISSFDKAKCQVFNSHEVKQLLKEDAVTKIFDFRNCSAH